MMKIEEKIRENAEKYSDTPAIIASGQALTYSQLHEAVARRAEQMREMKGSLIPLVASPTTDFLVDYFALHLVDAVAVPLAHDLPAAERERIVQIFDGGTAPAGVADILYTTGTTGQPKAVMVGHGAIWADAENLVEAQRFHHDVTYIVNGPLNHIGSLSKVYPTLYVGGTLRLLSGMKNLEAFYGAIDQCPCKAATFLVPASIRILLALSSDRLATCAHKLDFIETGAAPLSLPDMERLCTLLPHTRLYNTYASTETGIIATYDFNGGECLAGCLGKAMTHSAFFITPDGRVGCQGKTLMTGYWNDEEATHQVLRNGTILTADQGLIDPSGRLRLRGRVDDVVNVGGFKVAPTEVEDAAVASPMVRDCVCVAASHPVMGTVLKLLVVPGEDYCRKALVAFLKTKLEPHKLPVLMGEVEFVRRTFNGKIDRKSYR